MNAPLWRPRKLDFDVFQSINPPRELPEESAGRGLAVDVVQTPGSGAGGTVTQELFEVCGFGHLVTVEFELIGHIVAMAVEHGSIRKVAVVKRDRSMMSFTRMSIHALMMEKGCLSESMLECRARALEEPWRGGSGW